MAADKRFQVFVSSTYLDLRDERQAVTSALLQLDAFPAGMELFPVSDDDAWTLIKRVIDDCDYFLLVIGGRYGSVDPVDEIGYTEREYDYAVSRSKPVMAFLHGAPDSLTVSKSDIDPAIRERLAEFKSKVKRAKHVKFWTSADQLAGQVALSFAQFTKQYPAVGWIRADNAASPELLSELNSLRQKLNAAENKLERSRSTPPPGTEHLAQGSDTIKVSLYASAKYRHTGEPTRSIAAWTERTAITWDAILDAFGPSLLDECEQDRMNEILNEWATNTHLEIGVDALKKRLAALDKSPDEARITAFALSFDSDDFGTIIIQLVALGLMMNSEKRRSVTAKGTYWTLTPFGRTRAIQLRAIRRDSQTEST